MSEERTIWKYELDLRLRTRVVMPRGARLLHVASQGSLPTIWAEVDRNAPEVERLIAVVGTGHPAPSADQAVYVGTAICGEFVWHIYDGGEVQ